MRRRGSARVQCDRRMMTAALMAAGALLSCESSRPVVADRTGDESDAGQLEQGRIIRGDPALSEWWDLAIEGSELTEFEGRVVTVRLGDPSRPPERLGSGQAHVVDGSFSLGFDQVWEPGLYKLKRAFIDVDDDGRCEASNDRIFRDARAARADVLILEHGPTPIADGMPPSMSAEEDCLVFNAPWPTE